MEEEKQEQKKETRLQRLERQREEVQKELARNITLISQIDHLRARLGFLNQEIEFEKKGE